MLRAIRKEVMPVSADPSVVRSERQTPLSLVHSDLSLRCLSQKERLALGAICVCTLVLAAAYQYGRVFTGDEIGTLKYLKESPAYILTHFGTWLSMNYFILVEKGIASLCGATDWRLTLLPLAAAVAIIPLTASLALKFTGSTRAALIAATLAAFNPFLIRWAPAIRAYSLLVAFSLLAINEFFHWYRQRDWWSGVRCASAALMLLLAHLNGIYTVAFLVLLLVVEGVSAGFSGVRRLIWDSRTLWIPLAGVAIIVGAAYWRLLPDITKVNREWGTDTPPTSMGYIPQVFKFYMGVGYGTLLSVLLVVAGCWSAVRERRALLLLCAAVTLGPILMSLQGVSVHPGDYARYLLFSLPLLLILMAAGIDWLARRVPMRGGTITAWGLTGIILVCWTPYIRAQFLVKQQWPYARVAKFLHPRLQKNDVIVAGWGIGFTLSQFFDHPEDRIMLPNQYVNKIARQLDAPLQGRVFYVTGPGVLAGRKVFVRRFGFAEVTIYTGDTARALLQQWREDLSRRTDGRVLASFQGDYRLLALIEERLQPGESADRWRALAQRCRVISTDARNVPRHLQKAERAVRFP